MRRHQQILTPITASRRRGLRRCRACSGALAAAYLVAACNAIPPSMRLLPEAGAMAVARLEPRNSSTVRGTISFTQRGDKVYITGNFVDLVPGPHSIHIHAVGICSSANAASAGPVWQVEGKRIGDLPELYAGTEGNALVTTSTAELSVGTGAPNDVIGHSVVVHDKLDPDPKAEFGVRNGWLACGVIERNQGLDLKKLL